MKLIIAGGRDFGYNFLEDGTPDFTKNKEEYEVLCDEVSQFIADEKDVTIISGLARGADRLGCDFAAQNNFPIQGFAAEWGKFGNAAGPIRNKLMAKNADALIAFWDGKSRGTMHMIDYAYSLGLKVKVVMYEKTNSS